MKPIYLLALPLLAFTADTWQPFIVDQRVSVELPAPPTEMNLAKLAAGKLMGHARTWFLRAPEGTYLFSRIPHNSVISKADSAGRRAYYAGVLVSVLRNEQGQLLIKFSFPTAAGPGMEYKYRAVNRGTGKRSVKYGRFLVADSVGYSLNFLPADKTDTLGLTGVEQRCRFFISITVKP